MPPHLLAKNEKKKINGRSQQIKEAGTYDGVVEIHIVIEAKNNGVPSMSSYKRAILLC